MAADGPWRHNRKRVDEDIESELIKSSQVKDDRAKVNEVVNCLPREKQWLKTVFSLRGRPTWLLGPLAES